MEGATQVPLATRFALSALLFLASPAVRAQEPSSEPPANLIRLPKGTGLRLLLKETVSSKKAKPGDVVNFQVLDAVKADNLIVIPNKAPVSAKVLEVHRAGRAWHSGKLKLNLEPVTLIDLQKQALEALGTRKGDPTGAAGDWTRFIVESGGGGILLLPLAPLQHGNEAILTKGLVIHAATSDDILLERGVVEAAQPAPMEKAHSDASLIIYFAKSLGPRTIDLWCGAAKLGKARVAHKMEFTLAPGTYFFRAGLRSHALEFQLKDGGDYYLRVEMIQELSGWKWDLFSVEHDVGELESLDFLPPKIGEAPDITRIDLGQLRALPPFKKHR